MLSSLSPASQGSIAGAALGSHPQKCPLVLVVERRPKSTCRAEVPWVAVCGTPKPMMREDGEGLRFPLCMSAQCPVHPRREGRRAVPQCPVARMHWMLLPSQNKPWPLTSSSPCYCRAFNRQYPSKAIAKHPTAGWNVWQHNLRRQALLAVWPFPVFIPNIYSPKFIRVPLHLNSHQRTGIVCSLKYFWKVTEHQLRAFKNYCIPSKCEQLQKEMSRIQPTLCSSDRSKFFPQGTTVLY